MGRHLMEGAFGGAGHGENSNKLKLSMLVSEYYPWRIERKNNAIRALGGDKYIYLCWR